MAGKPSSVVVVGSGVVGAACALHLARAGCKVTMVDRAGFGSGCSHANCGYVCPSHVLPLAEPGAVERAMWAMLKPNSPFSIKPRFDLDLWTWLFRFARRCNPLDMLRSGQAIQALLESSFTLYKEMIETEGLACEWHHRGLMYVYKSAAAFEGFAPTDRLLRTRFNCGAQKVEARDLNAFEPALQAGLAGGWFYDHDAHLRPDKLMSELRRVLTARGVTIIENAPVSGFAGGKGRATGVITKGGTLEADAFVVATGAWTPLLQRELGCRIPIQPGKGYSITMPRPNVCPEVPLIFPETRVAVTPMDSTYRLGSTMEFAGYDESIAPERLQLLRDGAAPYLREPTAEPVIEQWFGWRPMTWDGLPIIGAAPARPNVVIAAGHNMLGISMAAATGKLVSELLTGSTPHLDPKPYAPTRF